MPRRKHKAEHKRHVARGSGRAVPRAQARKQTKARKRPIKETLPIDDPRFETAIREMNREHSLTAAARRSHISLRRLRRVLAKQGLIRRKGHHWVTKDNRLRKVLVMTRGRFRELTVRGFGEASLAAAHYVAAGQFVRTNDTRLLKPFEGKSVRAASGRNYPLETAPNALHRIAAMDTAPFHEIYEIIAAT